jgi:NAD(P)-dependent dehydrogenase (short-subunit alcohol dehydrogenase family)
MINLSGKKILVTGASSGIGKEVALLASSIGAEVILTGRNLSRLEQVASSLKGPYQIVICDLCNEGDIEKLADAIPEIDGLVNCAGMIQPFPIKFLKSKHIDTILHTNLYSSILLSSNILKSKKLKNNASVVFISSISANHPYVGGAMYSASKAGIESFSKSFALENASKKIRSNVVAPGLVNTSIFEETVEALSEKELYAIESQYPLGIGQPEDVANSVLFLLSDLSKWITGTTITLDGGLLINRK